MSFEIADVIPPVNERAFTIGERTTGTSLRDLPAVHLALLDEPGDHDDGHEHEVRPHDPEPARRRLARGGGQVHAGEVHVRHAVGATTEGLSAAYPETGAG